jgi:hypothetical protein
MARGYYITMMWNEANMALFVVIFRHLTGVTDENHETLYSGGCIEEERAQITAEFTRVCVHLP